MTSSASLRAIAVVARWSVAYGLLDCGFSAKRELGAMYHLPFAFFTVQSLSA
jgi:hypothetical protein